MVIMEMTQVVMIIPPKPVVDELLGLMKKLNLRYKASKALVYGPHITLKAMGRVPSENLIKVMSEIADITEDMRAFPLKIKGIRFYGSNANYPGIYYNVGLSETLMDLHEELVDRLNRYSDGKDRSYKELYNWRPHLTIVGDDISLANLKRAKIDPEVINARQSYNFNVDKITLVRHTGEMKPAFYSKTNFRLGGPLILDQFMDPINDENINS
jgi:2'-5' RNA ligase